MHPFSPSQHGATFIFTWLSLFASAWKESLSPRYASNLLPPITDTPVVPAWPQALVSPSPRMTCLSFPPAAVLPSTSGKQYSRSPCLSFVMPLVLHCSACLQVSLPARSGLYPKWAAFSYFLFLSVLILLVWSLNKTKQNNPQKRNVTGIKFIYVK